MRRLIAVLTAVVLTSVLALTQALNAQRPSSLEPSVFAIRDARVVTEPGHVLPKATVVIRDGRIEAVGTVVRVPPDARVIDGKGLTVYPGFIDALSNWGFDESLRRSLVGEPKTEDYASAALADTKPDNRKGLTPEFEVATALKADTSQADSWRKAGFTAHLIAPAGGFITGQSALVSLSDAPGREALLRTPVALHLAFTPVTGMDYPRVLMGIIAHCRQAMLDAGYYARRWAAFEQAGRTGPRPPHDPALAALGLAVDGKLPVVFEADSRDEIHRVLDFAQEFHLKPILYGGRDAWKVVDRIKQLHIPVVLRLNYTDAQGRRIENQRGRGFMAAFAQREEENELPQRVQDDHKRLLKEDLHNAAVLSEHGVEISFSTQGQSADAADKFRDTLHKVISDGSLSSEQALKALTTSPARLLGVQTQVGTITVGKAANLAIIKGDFDDPKAPVRYVFVDGVRFDYTAPQNPAAGRGNRAGRSGGRSGRRGAGGRGRGGIRATPPVSGAASSEPAVKNTQATELEADRKPKVHTGGNVLVRGATVLTVTHGTLPDTDILIHGGKIVRIGKHLTAPEGVTVIPAEGMYVMPGIIDTHCHFAISGGVNEFSLSIVPEVRVRDVVASDDVQIYRALAGGVTTSRLLHGSANCIGGQDAVIKLKYGQPASELIIHEAPRGVKFALGENVKRSDGRFPNTRLGVEAVLVRAFTEARAYQKSWQDYAKAKAAGKPVIEPRRDLRLEALADILNGDLKVHSHCYRQDEILMLMRTAVRFGFRIKSLHHVLEGYKIAAEIADHGASCSTFADWWAFKMESYDAVPFNASLLNDAGVSVCIKSDDPELMRHLYQEAAKCIKYGGMSETDALKTITLNGAKQLGIDARTGSIDLGKDGDLAIFDGHPLNSYARPEMTLVEGEVYFQRSDKLQPRSIATATPTRPATQTLSLGRNRSGCYALTGVTVHPASRPALARATVIIQNGKITDVLQGTVQKSSVVNVDGKDANALTIRDGERVIIRPVPAGTTVMRLNGLHVFPGMIDAASVVGLSEVASVRETQDYSPIGDFQPDLRASTGLNPDSAVIAVTRANGVLSALTGPEGGPISGQPALINLAGWVPRDMVVADKLALQLELPRPRPRFGRGGGRRGERPNTAELRRQSDDKLRRLKDLFRQAVAYDEGRKSSADSPVNTRLEALVPFARGLKPVIISAQRRKEILDALKFGDDLKLKVIIRGGKDAWKVADELKKRHVPLILGPVMALPSETYDPFDGPLTGPAKLHQAGVRFCICAHSLEMANGRNVPYEAAMAVSYGLAPDEGLKAVTLYPAEILGVADQLGSIDAGKRANLVIANGDILQASTQVLGLFIDGRPMPPTSKQTQLYERYKQRLKEVRQGTEPLGTK